MADENAGPASRNFGWASSPTASLLFLGIFGILTRLSGLFRNQTPLQPGVFNLEILRPLDRPPLVQKFKHVPLMRLLPRNLHRRDRPQVQPLYERRIQ